MDEGDRLQGSLRPDPAPLGFLGGLRGIGPPLAGKLGGVNSMSTSQRARLVWGETEASAADFGVPQRGTVY